MTDNTLQHAAGKDWQLTTQQNTHQVKLGDSQHATTRSRSDVVNSNTLKRAICQAWYLTARYNTQQVQLVTVHTLRHAVGQTRHLATRYNTQQVRLSNW